MTSDKASYRFRCWSVAYLLISSAKAFYVTPWHRIPKQASSLPSSRPISSKNRPIPCSRITLQSQVAFRETTASPQQLEREIVNLGKRGKTREALELYDRIESPSIRQMNGAIDACARARPTRLDQAFALLEDGVRNKHLKPNVFTFGALMSACSRARRADKAMELLKSMQDDYHVEPNAVVYSSAISACSHADPPNAKMALDLLKEAQQKVAMNVVGYNAALSACANAGQWESAIQLFEEMLLDSDPRVPTPDAVTYGTVLAACEKGEQWELVLKYTRRMQENDLPLDGMSATSALHACQQLGLAQEALDYLNLMKTSTPTTERMTTGWQRKGAREPLQGPDAVAYRLAISACARGGEWATGIYLLDELREMTKAPPDVVAYTSAIMGCEYAGEWRRAFGLLDAMRHDGVEANEFTMAAVLGACATACANAAKRQPVDKDEVHFPKQKALQLLNVMKRDPSVCDPNIVVYNAAIRACGEAMDLDRALKLLDDLESRGLEPTIVTFGSLMMACERVGDLQGASRVFKRMKEAGIEPNEIIYGAAISCCRKARDGERALLLLRKMIREELAPNVATFNTVIMALSEGRMNVEKAMLVYKLMKSKYSQANGRPNRQTYNILIRALAMNQLPQYAEAFIRKMRGDGFIPDVDLYTSTVTSYERTSQPLKALRLMESMQEDGYDFYDIKVLNEAFKKAVKLVNVVGRGLGGKSATASSGEDLDGLSDDYTYEDDDDDTGDLQMDFQVDADGEAFIKGKKML